MNEGRDEGRRAYGDKPYTVVGECEQIEDGTFVDWVWATSVASAAHQVTKIRNLEAGAVIAVFAGHHVDLLM